MRIPWRFVSILCLLVLLPAQACTVPIKDHEAPSAESLLWRSVGPGGGGWIQSLAFDPQDPDILYAGCDVGGFYFSRNGGQNWQVSNHGLRDYYLQAIAVHPKDSRIIVLGTPSGIHRSADQGKTWEWVRTGFPAPERYSFSCPVACLAFDRQSPHLLYAGIGRPREGKGGQGAIYRSDDKGFTWKNISSGQLPADAIVSDIKVKPGDSSVILAATHRGIFRSDDEGGTWKLSSKGLPHLHTQRLAFSFSVPDVVYLTLCTTGRDGQPWNGGVYRSDDEGRTWRAVNGKGMPNTVGGKNENAYMTSNVVQIAVDPADENTVCVGSRDWVTAGVRKTADGGNTWSLLPAGSVDRTRSQYGWLMEWGPAIECMDISPIDTGCIAVGTAGHVFLSTDGGRSWNQRYTRLLPDGAIAGNGLETTCLHNIIPDPAWPERIYFCYLDIGLFVSEDGGRSFHRNSKGMRGECFTLVVDPKTPSTIWAGTGEWGRNVGEVCRSDDGGRTWQAVGKSESGLSVGQTKHLVLDVHSLVEKRRLLVTSRGNGIFESRNGGMNWHCINSNLPAEAAKEPRGLQLNPSESNHIRIALGGGPEEAGVYETLNGGVGWRRVNKELVFADIKCLTADPRDFNILYLGTREFSDRPSGRVFSGGAFKSSDGGRTWDRILDYHFVQTIAISPVDPQVIYVATTDHPYHDDCAAEGVLKSADGGLTWRHENKGLSHRNISCISMSPHDPGLLFVGTGGNGAFVGRDSQISRSTKKGID